MMLAAADGSCFIQPVLLPGQMTAVASNRDVQSAVGDVLLDCICSTRLEVAQQDLSVSSMEVLR